MAGDLNGRIERPIVFFDGVCVLCNGFVDRIRRADREGRLRFAPLQGETASRLLPRLSHDPADWSVVYLDERGTHLGADAVLEICRRLGGWWRVSDLLRVVPRTLRDALYRGIARGRYDWFGRRNACRAPGEDGRFLP